MKFTTQLQKIDFDLKGYLKVLDASMEEHTQRAARSWLYTVLQIIPTWSGASRATFEALGSSVGFTVTYGPQRARLNREYLGRMASRGGVEKQGSQTYFYYETDLRYLEYNEFNRATPGAPPRPYGYLRNPTPYRFLEAGAKDFKSYVKTVRLPNPSLFISGRPI